jgi:ATP-binding cassette subfamily B multidrug efflux pump
MRFYDVQKGAVRIDGVDVKDMESRRPARPLRRRLQDPFLFSGTMAATSVSAPRIQDADVEQAAEDVNLADFIRTLPGGFKEKYASAARRSRPGRSSSSHSRERWRTNPKILILDEATSSVDTETEFRVRDALSRMVEGRTSLIIAHRLSTIQRADKIIVMHKGQVREMGRTSNCSPSAGSTTSCINCSIKIRK